MSEMDLLRRIGKKALELKDIADPKRLPSHGDPKVLRDRALKALEQDK